jgi:hypothetical protein
MRLTFSCRRRRARTPGCGCGALEMPTNPLRVMMDKSIRRHAWFLGGAMMGAYRGKL